MIINKLEWDSLNFGINIGSITLPYLDQFKINQIHSLGKKYGYNLIYISSMKQYNVNNLFFEEKVIYSKKREIFQNKLYYQDNITLLKSESIPNELYDLAILSGEYSRFNIDLEFPKDKFKFLYKKWIENFNNLEHPNSRILVLKINNSIKGFLAYKIEAHKSTACLMAISPDLRGCGYGLKLWQHYENSLDLGIKDLFIPTQGSNIPAISLYNKLGYSKHLSTYTYHLWI